MSDGLSWEAITTMGSLIGLLLTTIGSVGVVLLGAIFRRLGDLGEAMARQQTEMASIMERWKECRDGDHESHRRIWGTLDEHGRRIDEHERRIGAME